MKALEEEHMYHHFSHHHPVVRTNFISERIITCSGCTLNIFPSTDYYRCKTCPFYLHRVCYNMPRKAQHPGHPDHVLTLHATPSLSAGNETFNCCEACGHHHVNGFYYKCPQCSICYHILCLALPLSVAINPHLHTLKLEFSPPYGLQCDVCKAHASCNRWLYRCKICEFDTHLACAISNQRTQSLPQHPTAPLPYPLTKQIMHSSASVMESKQRQDYINEGAELMQLVSQDVTRNIRENNRTQENCLKTGNKDTDQSSLVSAELISISPSYQFSDGCFSIDLARSYSSLDRTHQEIKEPKFSDASGLQRVKDTMSHDKNNNYMLDRITSNLESSKQETIYAKKESFYSRTDSRMSEAFLAGNETYSGELKNRKKMLNESRSMSGQSNKSEKGSTSGSSSWWKLFQHCFSPTYESTTVFSDGRS